MGSGYQEGTFIPHLREKKLFASKGVLCSPSLTHSGKSPWLSKTSTSCGFTLFGGPSPLCIIYATPQFFHLLGRAVPWGLIMRLRHRSCERPRKTSCICFEIPSSDLSWLVSLAFSRRWEGKLTKVKSSVFKKETGCKVHQPIDNRTNSPHLNHHKEPKNTW